MLRGESRAAASVRDLDEAFTSVVVIGELLYGARRSANSEANLARIAEFASSITALPTDRMTAEAYARIGMASGGRAARFPTMTYGWRQPRSRTV
jgi:predicted nucleic acid-binding protein